MPTNTETEFSIYNQFDAHAYADRLFRERPEGIRLSAEYSFQQTKGEVITRTGFYELEDRQYVFKYGFDVIGEFYHDIEPKNGAYYADEVTFGFLNPIEIDGKESWMKTKFTSAPVAKKGGAPF